MATVYYHFFIFSFRLSLVRVVLFLCIRHRIVVKWKNEMSIFQVRWKVAISCVAKQTIFLSNSMVCIAMRMKSRTRIYPLHNHWPSCGLRILANKHFNFKLGSLPIPTYNLHLSVNLYRLAKANTWAMDRLITTRPICIVINLTNFYQ